MHITVVQNERFIRIEIRQFSGDKAFIGAAIAMDIFCKILPPVVISRYDLSGELSMDEAVKISERFRFACHAARTLEAAICHPTDFDRKWTVKRLGRILALETEAE